MPKNNYLNTIIYIALFLFGAYLSFSYFCKLDLSFSTLLKEYNSTRINDRDLFAGNQISQEFQSPYDNLGIVSLRFKTFNRINNDTLTFRLKEKDNPNWLYSAYYKTDQFQNRQFFPFGFPVIPDSKGKTYIFELESQSGSQSSHVAIDDHKPVLSSRHQYPIRNLSLLNRELYNFIALKIINFFSNISLIYPIFYYFVPFLFFVIDNWLLRHKGRHLNMLILFPLLALTFQNFISLTPPLYWELIPTLTWGIYLYCYRLDSKINLSIALAFIPFIIIKLIDDDFTNAETVAYLFFVFLIITYIHSFLINFFEIDNTVSVRSYTNGWKKEMLSIIPFTEIKQHKRKMNKLG